MARTQMARDVKTPQRRRRARVIPSSFTLAAWRLRPMWRLLLIAGLGNIAAVLLVCVVPLFSQVALSAGILGVLNGPADATHIIINGSAFAPTQASIDNTQDKLNQIIAQDMGPYAQKSAPQFSIILPDLTVTSNSSGANTGGGTLQIIGVDPSADPSQSALPYTIVVGQAPASSGDALEVALTQTDATALGVSVGSTLQTHLPTQGSPQPNQPPGTLTMRVVGLYSPTNTFTNQSARIAGEFGGGPIGPGGFSPNGFYTVLASNQAVIATLEAYDAKHGITPNGQSNNFNGPPPIVNWAYALDGSHVSANSLNDVIDRLNRVQTDVSGQFNNSSSGMQGLYLDSGAYQALSTFRIQILLLQIPLLLLLLQVMGLVLLFVRMVADMLVDRQAEAIATLRSRGATRRQVFNMFTLHNISLSLIALVVGPLAAIPIVRALAERALPPASQSALAALSGNPLAIAWDVRWYALAAMIVSGIAMVFSTNRAASNNIITLRRENARTNAKPFWQRFNLDLIFGVISLLGYVAYSIAVRQVSPTIQLVLSPLALIASLLMLLAAALLFLRALPPLLGLVARLAARGRGAASMLALTQMARAPRQPIRMTLLLALATAFTLFTLVFSASQAQRLIDVSAFQTGADFTGSLPANSGATQSTADLTARYLQIPGVTAASLGYSSVVNPSPGAGSFPIRLLAVDPATFTQAALWSEEESSQPLSALMAQLSATRASAMANDAVPALVDDATWQQMQLTPNAQFALQPPGYSRTSMNFIAIGHVAHIPTVYGSAQGGGGFDGFGGVLADYPSFAAAYHHDLTTIILNATAPPNTAWIATRDDAASLASVRKALSSGILALTSLQDTRALIANQRNNPLQIEFANTLLIGAAVALLLALIGIWVGSWLNARGRLVNFAVLRAIGVTPRQMRGMLVWEQAIIYLAGIALGVALGWILSLTALPMLIFVELATTGNFQRTPNVPPARVVIPGATLGLGLGALVVICILALALTMVALARLSLGQTLRLNED